MVNITLTIPEELKTRLQKHKIVNWSAVVRRALEEHLKEVEMIEAIAQKSRLTQKDADEIMRKIKRDIARSHRLLK